MAKKSYDDVPMPTTRAALLMTQGQEIVNTDISENTETLNTQSSSKKRKKEKKESRVQLLITPSTHKKLKELALLNDTSVNQLINDAIEEKYVKLND